MYLRAVETYVLLQLANAQQKRRSKKRKKLEERIGQPSCRQRTGSRFDLFRPLDLSGSRDAIGCPTKPWVLVRALSRTDSPTANVTHAH